VEKISRQDEIEIEKRYRCRTYTPAPIQPKQRDSGERTMGSS
jgi:hypothetical protein